MPRRAARVNLSEHWQNRAFKCYKKNIGGRRFYLTADRAQSERIALALLAVWSRINAAGHSHWTEADIAGALQVAGVQERPISIRGLRPTQRLHAAVEEYLTDYKPRVSASRYYRHVSALSNYKKYQKDCLLTDIDWNALNRTVAHYRSRPAVQRGSPMAVATVQTTLKAIHALYDWLDLAGRWEAPRRFDRVFRVSYQSLKSATELKREGDGQEVFTLEELTTLWKMATPRQRLYMGLALGTGETAQGLADLLKSNFIQESGQLIIDRNRGKTGVRGVYPLWAEVTILVETEMNRDKTEVLAFKTMDGNPLVWFHKTGRVDSISKTWANLLKRSEDVRPLGFATLRKTGASIVERLTESLEVAQLYLSHKGKSVAERHYLARHFDRLADALTDMREYLAPLFSVETAKPTSEAA